MLSFQNILCFSLFTVYLIVFEWMHLNVFLSNRSQHVMVDGCRSKLVYVVSGQEYHREVFWARYCSFCAPLSRFPYWTISLLVMPMTTLLLHVVPSSGVGVAVMQLQNLWTVISSRLVCGVTSGGWNWIQVQLRLWYFPSHSHVVHPQSPPLTIYTEKNK